MKTLSQPLQTQGRKHGATRLSVWFQEEQVALANPGIPRGTSHLTNKDYVDAKAAASAV